MNVGVDSPSLSSTLSFCSSHFSLSYCRSLLGDVPDDGRWCGQAGDGGGLAEPGHTALQPEPAHTQVDRYRYLCCKNQFELFVHHITLYSNMESKGRV